MALLSFLQETGAQDKKVLLLCLSGGCALLSVTPIFAASLITVTPKIDSSVLATTTIQLSQDSACDVDGIIACFGGAFDNHPSITSIVDRTRDPTLYNSPSLSDGADFGGGVDRASKNAQVQMTLDPSSPNSQTGKFQGFISEQVFAEDVPEGPGHKHILLHGHASGAYRNAFVLNSPAEVEFTGTLDGTMTTGASITVGLGLFAPATVGTLELGSKYGAFSFSCGPFPACESPLFQGLDLKVSLPAFSPIIFALDIDLDAAVACLAITSLCSDSTTADFGHTLQLSMVIPQGTGLTAGSGFIPILQPVPEPGTVVLLGTGMVGVAGLRLLKPRLRWS